MDKKIVKKSVTKVIFSSESVHDDEFILDIPLDRLVKQLLGIDLTEEDLEELCEITLSSKEMISYEDEKIGLEE